MQPNRKIRQYILSNNITKLKEHLKSGDINSGLIEFALTKFTHQNDIDIVDFILKNGGKTDSDRSLLMREAVGRKDGGLDIIKTFLKNGADPNAFNSIVLAEAIKKNNIEAIKELFKSGSSLENIKNQIYLDVIKLDDKKLREMIIDELEKKTIYKYSIDKSKVNIDFLRSKLNDNGSTGMLILAKSGLLIDLFNTDFMKDVSLNDLTATDRHGVSVLSILAFRGETQKLFEALYLQDKNYQKLRFLYSSLSILHKKEINIRDLKDKLNHFDDLKAIKSKKINKIKFNQKSY